jgi:hypothetical protein
MNGLNSSIKRYRLADWIKTQYPIISCLPKIHLKGGDTQIESERKETMIYHTSRNQEQTGVAVLIFGKVDFKSKLVGRIKTVSMYQQREQPIQKI